MSERRIKPVKSNEDKRKTYAAIMGKYKHAIESGFLGEAELIVYAYLEDRLRSFIYYSDGLDRWNSNDINENMARIYGNKNDIKDISSKIDIIKKAINVKRLRDSFPDDDYAQSLINIYSIAFDSVEMNKLIKSIDKWREYRNEIVHALLNKDLDDLHVTYKTHVEEGYILARKLDNIVNSLKRT